MPGAGETPSAETERVRKIWAKLAPKYDQDIAFFERLLFADSRSWVCSQAEGRVLEVGVGTGLNLDHYAPDIHLTGVDFSPPMLDIARQRAQRLGRAIDLQHGDAQALEFPDGSFDTVVCTLALCSIPDDRQTLHEVGRVLRPGGRFLSLEHVASHIAPVRAVETVMDWIMVRTQGDHLLRNPLNNLRAEGLETDLIERLKWGIVQRLIAHKPA